MHSSFFHAHRLGYRRNPFGALETEEWTAVSFLPIALEELLDQSPVHLQLLGPKGVGKSSTMHRLLAHERARGTAAAYEYIPEGQHRFTSDLRGLDCFLLDEAQRLNWRERRRWLQHAKRDSGADGLRFIIASHRDLRRIFHRRGLPLASFDLATAVSPAYYQRWLDRRLDFFALSDQPRLTLAADAAAWLYAAFGRDMREAEYFLYDVWQETPAPRRLSAADLAIFRPD